MSAIDKHEPICPTFARFDCVRIVLLIFVASICAAASLMGRRLSKRSAPDDDHRQRASASEPVAACPVDRRAMDASGVAVRLIEPGLVRGASLVV
jgi:hypothetical protein